MADSKVLVLAALAGAAGVGLAAAFYRGFRSRRRGSWPRGADAPGAVSADDPGPPRGQAEVLRCLEALIRCVSELKDEMRSLKSALPTLQDQVRLELRGRHEARPHCRTTPTRRKRAAGAGAGAGGRSSEEAESEGGYMTALTDSEEEEPSDEEQVDELCVLLESIDSLRQGPESDKRRSLELLLQRREEFGQKSSFLWRLTRAYCDLHDISSTLEEKKTHAETGKKMGAEAVSLNPTCADSHLWYAILCGLMAEYDTLQNKIKYGYIFKDHLDKAIQLKPLDPLSYYLMGRWCYAVAQLSWIERKVAATLFGEPPSAKVEDALRNFLKVEEIQPGYSKHNYVFLAKCYKDLGRRAEAREMCRTASSMNTVTKEDEDAERELSALRPAL